MIIKLRIEQQQSMSEKKNMIAVEFDDVRSLCEAITTLAKSYELRESSGDETCGIVATVRFPDDDKWKEAES